MSEFDQNTQGENTQNNNGEQASSVYSYSYSDINQGEMLQQISRTGRPIRAVQGPAISRMLIKTRIPTITIPMADRMQVVMRSIIEMAMARSNNSFPRVTLAISC